MRTFKTFMNVIFIALGTLYQSATGQEMTFEVEISHDTILFGNSLELKYSIENSQGDFEAPYFDGLRVISGPNMSSQFSMVNGRVSQRSEYSYILVPLREGTVHIGEATFNNGKDLATIDPISIFVLANPDGIQHEMKKYGFHQRIVIGDSTRLKVDTIQQKLKKIKKFKI